MTYILSWDRHVVTKTCTGYLSADEIVRSAEEIACHPSFDELQFIINDYSAVAGYVISADTIERIAVIYFGSLASNPNFQVLVVSSDPAILALFNSAIQPKNQDSAEMRAFPSVQSAKQWIAEQPTRFSPRPRR